MESNTGEIKFAVACSETTNTAAGHWQVISVRRDAMLQLGRATGNPLFNGDWISAPESILLGIHTTSGSNPWPTHHFPSIALQHRTKATIQCYLFSPFSFNSMLFLFWYNSMLFLFWEKQWTTVHRLIS